MILENSLVLHMYHDWGKYTVGETKPQNPGSWGGSGMVTFLLRCPRLSSHLILFLIRFAGRQGVDTISILYDDAIDQ